MQRSLRFNENQYIYLANKAKNDFALSAYLWKKSRESLRWQQKYFVLYQNFLFYYENDSSVKPMGCYLLEGSYCEHVIPSAKMNPDRQFMLAISFRGEGGRQIELACDNQEQCDMWVAAIQKSSFNLVRMHKEELEKKHQHLLQILDTERGAKNQYMIQVEEQADEIAKLRAELLLVKQQLQKMKVNLSKSGILTEEETEELRKIKKQLSAKSLAKVQSLMRGWLCRRRWMSIVNEYIKSPHAEMMRVRNRLVFAMVADEEDYVAKLSVLVSVFYRTLKMAASSKKPLISHEDVNSIFLNCETILFLHQIFSKGLNARLEAWPRLILGDLFDMLLPMLSIYQEYVRNHHYSLQVLAECKQKSGDFGLFIQRYEEKPICEGRTIEHYLTVPMWQIPRYIQSLCQILAHTPHDHVERKSLEYAKHQLETLSTNMRDEVSETENIRRNLAIERQIVEGCDILLDVQQIFIRQGTMLQACLESKPIVAASASKSQISETGSGGSSSNNSSGSHYHLQHSSNSSLSASAVSGTNTSASSALSKKRSSPAIILGGGGTSNVSGGGSGSGGGSAAMTSYFSGMDKKEAVKQCFLFSNHLIITSRSSSGKLHLNKLLGKIPLVNATLLDDDLFSIPVPTSVMPNSTALSSSSSSATITSASSSFSSSSPLSPVKESPNAEFEGRYFKLVVSHQQVSYLFIFVAPTNQEKEAWVTDIGQCIENIHISGLLTGQVRFEESSSIRMLQSVRSDPSLFQDDPHIKFSRGTNSCRVPQIRYATVEKLLDRLVDVRFLSIEFLNTFLMTYRYFTTAQRVMQVLRQALLDPQSTPNSAGGEGFTIGSPNGSSNSYSTLSDASEHQMSPGAGPQGNHLSTNTNPMSPHLQTGNQSVTQKGPYINGAAATAVPSTPSPVEQMVGNPSTYRLRKNTAPSVVNSINNQSADAIKRRMAQAPRNRIFSDAAVPIGQCKPPMTSQNSQQNESNASKRLSGDQGSILGFGRKSEPNNNGMNSSNEVEPLVLSEHVGESSPSSPEAVTTMSESSVSTSTINSAVSATTSNLRASLNSIGEFVSARKQQLTSKQLSVDSDDSSFVVYSIKDSDTESLRNERRFSMESVEETEKNIIERVKEVALKISESSFNNSNNNHSNNNHNINNNNNHTGGINSHNHSSSSDQFEKSLLVKMKGLVSRTFSSSATHGLLSPQPAVPAAVVATAGQSCNSALYCSCKNPANFYHSFSNPSPTSNPARSLNCRLSVPPELMTCSGFGSPGVPTQRATNEHSSEYECCCCCTADSISGTLSSSDNTLCNAPIASNITSSMSQSQHSLRGPNADRGQRDQSESRLTSAERPPGELRTRNVSFSQSVTTFEQSSEERLSPTTSRIHNRQNPYSNLSTNSESTQPACKCSCHDISRLNCARNRHNLRTNWMPRFHIPVESSFSYPFSSQAHKPNKRPNSLSSERRRTTSSSKDQKSPLSAKSEHSSSCTSYSPPAFFSHPCSPPCSGPDAVTCTCNMSPNTSTPSHICHDSSNAPSSLAASESLSFFYGFNYDLYHGQCPPCATAAAAFHRMGCDGYGGDTAHGRNHSSMMQLHPSSGLGSAFGDQVPAKRFSLDSYLHSRNEATNSTSNKKIHHAPGVVVTSSRKSTRRSSLQTAAAAFAAATAGANTLTNSSSLSGIGGGPTTKSSSQSGSGGGTSGGSGASNANSTSAAYSSTLPSRSLANRRNNHMSSPSSSAVSSVSNNLFSKNTKGRKRYCSRHKIEHGGKRSSDFSSATSMRVLHVLRHWSTKFPEDFEEGEPANQLLISMLKEAQSNECLTAEEEKIVNGIYRTLCKLNHERALTNFEESKDDFVALLADLKHETNPTGDFSYPQVPPVTSSIVANGLVSLEGMSALELAENLTFIEHKVFSAIPFWEFFNQAWVKEDKQEKAPKILLTTKRFNDVSTLVATTILRESTEKGRAAVIEKWAGVADVCKGLKNFNSVLEIISAFGRTPVYRLRKTWERISKQTRSTIDKLQILVSTDGHFKNLRDALHKCDPPALPYLGMYLTDLTFIEDGTPMVTSDALINFSRMRMVSNVVQEIRLYQQTPYQTEIKADTLKWLLQSGHVWTEEQMYNRSLQLEPRPSSGNSQNQQTQQQQTHHGSRSHQL
ncbi:ras-specific guanine nucleotide-releasing factor 1-like isoform X3 [Convolutriloba macropyga]|uniref:ras-specific guanine nucleotide-releasing factor 1-like isoform X3 n=1 Tax=Convolutriloba macropyga TaxID=536237 RepID=UPI003F522FD1